MQAVLLSLDELQAYSKELIDSFVARLPQPEASSTMPDFLNKHQACQYLGNISVVSLDKLTREGKIPALRPTPDRIVFYREDLKQYLLQTKTR